MIVADFRVNWLEYTGCVCHDMNMDSGNNWSMTRMFVPVGNMIWKDCIFYNMPYTKSLLEGRYPGDSPAYITFANNLVMLAQNKNVATGGFTVLKPGSNLATGTEVEIANNIFVGPQKGSKILANVPVDVTVKVYDENGMVVKDSEGNDVTEVVKDSLTNYNNTAITDIHNASVYFDNNVIDESAYIDLETMANTLTSYETGASFVTLGTNYKLTDFDWFSWDDEKPFQKPDEDQYFMLKSNAWFTDGLGLNVDDLTSPTYIGPSVAYLDAFPTPANVNIKVDAPAFVDYSVKPEKSQYYIGDEVTVSINDHNSYYRTFSRFEGWSDGESQMNRKIVVEGDIDLTATLTQTIPVLAAFDFSSVTGKDMASVNAEIYHDMDKAYQAKCSAIVCLGDSTTMSADSLSFEKFLYVDGVFNTRAEKFSEDDAEMRMPIVSRRTKANLKLLGRSYALIQLSTKGFKDVTVAGFVGTDNNSAKLQAIEYSLDNENWTRVADKELTAALKWEEITAALPEACNDQDVIYVRFIGDVSKGHVIHPDYTDWGMDENGNFPEGSTFFAQDAFEYLGNILITGTAADGSGITNVVSAENTNAQTYNIAGQKVGNGYKGIVIVNGRKYVTK